MCDGLGRWKALLDSDGHVVGCDEVAFADEHERGHGAGASNDRADEQDLVQPADESRAGGARATREPRPTPRNRTQPR